MPNYIRINFIGDNRVLGNIVYRLNENSMTQKWLKLAMAAQNSDLGFSLKKHGSLFIDEESLRAKINSLITEYNLLHGAYVDMIKPLFPPQKVSMLRSQLLRAKETSAASKILQDSILYLVNEYLTIHAPDGIFHSEMLFHLDNHLDLDPIEWNPPTTLTDGLLLLSYAGPGLHPFSAYLTNNSKDLSVQQQVKPNYMIWCRGDLGINSFEKEKIEVWLRANSLSPDIKKFMGFAVLGIPIEPISKNAIFELLELCQFMTVERVSD